MILRPYQAEAIADLWNWFGRHEDGNPIMVASVGAGKSLMIAEVARRANEEYPGTRVLVLMHQKELLAQNVGKLAAIWPGADVGVFSASVGRKQLDQQITYATIGSVWKRAHELGRIDIIMADECHLINPKQEGMWRAFLKDMGRYNPSARVIGWTGTEFRGNGVYLTAHEEALFSHVATRVEMTKLLELGYLAPLVPAATETRIKTDDVRMSGDDYVVSDLAKATDTDELVQSTASEICTLFSDRKRWLVFAVTVEHAEHMRDALRDRGVSADMVSALTPSTERDRLIESFRRGEIRCLVNVAVLTTGFDVPEIDAIAMLRATKSPVLYVQIAGRGMRTADGKTDCLWADFTDTTIRLGPVDKVKGRLPVKGGKGEAPFKLCPNCGSRNTAGATECIDCGHAFPPPVLIKHHATSGDAAVLSSQLAKETEVPITNVTYCLHRKPESPTSMRVEYWQGLEICAKEWVFFDHQGYPRQKAERWWRLRTDNKVTPSSTEEAVIIANAGGVRAPTALVLNRSGKHAEIISHKWD